MGGGILGLKSKMQCVTGSHGPECSDWAYVVTRRSVHGTEIQISLNWTDIHQQMCEWHIDASVCEKQKIT